MRSFDYVIVGGGSAGCVLANRLSADPTVSVCLLEAGPRDRHPLIHVPLGILWMMRSRVLNWNFRTAAEPALGGRRLFWPRGRTLGGSSSSNAMIYTRGHPADYDHWEAAGNAGWSHSALLPYFRRAERWHGAASPFHGIDGPLEVSELRSPNPLSEVFVAAAVESGFARNDDFNGAHQEGVGLYHVTQKRGRRWSAARAYLDPARGRPNLTIITRAQATRVLCAGLRASGVEFHQDGRRQQVGARREVVLAAGAIQSPQLLMLSGIGDPAELGQHGIACIHPLHGVGRNLQDHLDVCLVDRCARPVSYGLTPRTLLLAIPDLFRYLLHGRGRLTTNGAEAGGFVRSRPQEALPDLQFHFTPGPLRDHGRDLGFLAQEGYSLHVCQLRPRSRGRVTLASADPFAAPVIQANYLGAAEDLEALVRATRIARKVLAAPAFAPYRNGELIPGPGTGDDDEALRAFVRAHAETIYHPVGTCRMGNDALAVVDAELRVHGMEGLRVVDASIMPTLVGANTNAPTIAIAERAADLILGLDVLAPATVP